MATLTKPKYASSDEEDEDELEYISSEEGESDVVEDDDINHVNEDENRIIAMDEQEQDQKVVEIGPLPDPVVDYSIFITKEDNEVQTTSPSLYPDVPTASVLSIEEEGDTTKSAEQEDTFSDDSFCLINLDSNSGDFICSDEDQYADMSVLYAYASVTSNAGGKTFAHLFESEEEQLNTTYHDQIVLEDLLARTTTVQYLNGYLLNESELLKKFSSDEFGDDIGTTNFGAISSFYALVLQYFETVTQKAIPTQLEFEHMMKALKTKTKQPDDMFTFNTKTLTSPASYCGDQHRLTESVKVITAQLQTDSVNRLQNEMTKVRSHFYQNVCSVECQVECCRLFVTNFIKDIIERNDPQEIGSQLRHCISVLFHFERLSHNERFTGDYITRFRNHIRLCTRRCVAVLLKRMEVDDHRFIIFNTIRSRYIAQWGREFIQIPNVRDDTCVDIFLAQLSVFLTPMKDKSGQDFILLEEDYLQLWEQFPFFDLVDYLLVGSKHDPNSSFNDWSTTFSVLETILFILSEALKSFNVDTHRQFARQLGHTIVRYVQIATCILYNANQPLFTGMEETINYYYDQLFVKSFYALLRSSNMQLGLWSFLIELPYGHLAQRTIAALFFSILSLNWDSQRQVQYGDLASFPNWNYFVQNCSLREHFSKQMAALSGENKNSSWFYLIPVIAKLASHSSSISFAAVVVQELYLVAFINVHTRQVYNRDICHAIATICSTYPDLLSMLVTLTDDAIQDQQHKAFYNLFKACVPHVRRWKMSKSDLTVLGQWLQKKTDTIHFRISAKVIESLAWSYSEPAPNFPPEDQRSICLAVIEGLHYHNMTRTGGVKAYIYGGDGSDYAQYEKFATKVILQAKFQSSMGQALVHLEKLELPSLSVIYQNSSKIPGECEVLQILSAYLVLHLSEEGWQRAALEASTKVLQCIDAIIASNQVDLAIRFLSDICFRFCNREEENVPNVSDLILKLLRKDASSTWTGVTVGRIMSVSSVVGAVTKKISAVVISSMRSEEERIAHSRFWINQISKIQGWRDDRCCLYVLEAISRELFRTHTTQSEVNILLANALGDWCLIDKPATSYYFFSGTDAFFPKGIFEKISFFNDAPFLMLATMLGRRQVEEPVRKMVWDQISRSLTAAVPFVRYGGNQQQLLFSEVLQSLSDQLKPQEFAIYRTLYHAVRYSQDLLSFERRSEGRKALLGTDVHAVLPFYWQAFFTMLMESVITDSGVEVLVGPHFLKIDSFADIQMKVSKLLHSLSTYYGTKVQEIEMKSKSESDLEKMRLCNRLFSTYKAMSAWITSDPEELFKDWRNVAISRSRFQDIIEGSPHFWYDLFDSVAIEAEYEDFIKYADSVFPGSVVSELPAVPSSKSLDVQTLKEEERSHMKNPVAFDDSAFTIQSKIGFDIKNVIQMANSLQKQFYQLVTETANLDTAYIDHIPKLITNTEKVLNLSMRCYRGPMCKEPGTVKFTVMAKQENEAVRSYMMKNRNLWGMAMQTKHIALHRDNACQLIVDMGATLSRMVFRNERKACVSMFFELIDNFKTIVEAFPPIRDPLFFHILRPIALVFVEKDPQETRTLLSIILRNDTALRSEWFGGLFNPMCCHAEWPDILAILDSVRKDSGADQVYQLYKRFNIKKWLQLDTVNSLERILTHSISIASENNGEPRMKLEAEHTIYTFYLDLLSEIMLAHQKPQLYYTALELVFKHLLSNPRATKGIADLLALMSVSYAHLSLDMIQLRRIIHIISDSSLKIRNSTSKNTLYSVCSPSVLQALSQLIVKVFGSLDRKEIAINEAEDVKECFFLLCDAFRAYLLADNFVYPWNLNDKPPVSATDALDKLIEVVNSLDSPFICQHVWNMYYIMIKTNHASYSEVFTEHLSKVNWERFEVTSLEQIAQMIEFLDILRMTSPAQTTFICDIVSKMPWLRIIHIIDVGEQETDLYRQIAVLFGHVIIRNNAEFNKALESVIDSLQWSDYVSLENLNRVLYSYDKLFTEFNIKMKESAQESLDLLFRLLQRFVKLPPKDRHTDGIRLSIHSDSMTNLYNKQVEVNRNAVLITYMRFLLHTFSVILQKKDKDGELYLFLDKHREGLYHFCSSMILGHELDTELVDELVKVFNVCQIQLPSFAVLTQQTLKMIRQTNNLDLCVYVLKSGCTSIGISDQLALLSEVCIRMMYDLSPGPKVEMWLSIAQLLDFNQTTQDYFAMSCTKQGCALSLYALAVKMSMQGVDQKEILRSLNGWIQKIDMLHRSQVILMSDAHELKNDQNCHQDEYLLTLIHFYLSLIAKETTSRINRIEVHEFIEKLLKIYASSIQSKVGNMFKSVGGMFSKVFSGSDISVEEKKLMKHSKQMIWTSTLLAWFMLVKYEKANHMLTDHSMEDKKFSYTVAQLQKHVNDAKDRSETNGYVKQAIQITTTYIDNPDTGLNDAQLLLEQIAPVLQHILE